MLKRLSLACILLFVALFALSLGLSSPALAEAKTLHRAFTQCSYCECQSSSPMQVSIPPGHFLVTVHVKGWSAANLIGYPQWIAYSGLEGDGKTWTGWGFPIGGALPLLKGVQWTITPEHPKSGDEVWFREEYSTTVPVVLRTMLSSIHWYNGAGACFQIASEHWVTIDTGASLASSGTAVGGPSVTTGPRSPDVREIVNNWNTSGCNLTDKVELRLDQPTRLARVELWYHWSPNETSVPYSLTRDGKIISNGTLTRAECDAYQAAWCVARGLSDSDLGPGVYTIQTQHAAVCQNAGSGGRAFIRAYGSNASPPASTTAVTSNSTTAATVAPKLLMAPGHIWRGKDIWGANTNDIFWRVRSDGHSFDNINAAGTVAYENCCAIVSISGNKIVISHPQGHYIGTISSDRHSITGYFDFVAGSSFTRQFPDEALPAKYP